MSSHLVRQFNTCVHSNNPSPFPVDPGPSSIDLSKARKLKDVALLSNSLKIQWVLMALRTITTDHRDFRKVSLCAPCLSRRTAPAINLADPAAIRREIGEVAHTQWSEFDHVLAQLWESHSIRLEVLYYNHQGGAVCRCANRLLPEATKRGMVDLVDRNSTRRRIQ